MTMRFDNLFFVSFICSIQFDFAARDKCNDVDEKYLSVAKLSCQQEASERAGVWKNKWADEWWREPASKWIAIRNFGHQILNGPVGCACNVS